MRAVLRAVGLERSGDERFLGWASGAVGRENGLTTKNGRTPEFGQRPGIVWEEPFMPPSSRAGIDRAA